MTPYYHPYWVDDDSDSLEHYGVLGMKWGVRRYQNADGTLTETGKKKLEKYKDKEYTRVDKLRQKAQNRYERAVYKRKGKGLSTPSKQEAYKKSIKETYEKELRIIKNMKYSDMQSDKRAVGNQFLKSSAGSAAMSLAFSALSPGVVSAVWFGPVLPSSISNAKTRNRLKRYEQKNS